MFTLNQMACLENSRVITCALKHFFSKEQDSFSFPSHEGHCFHACACMHVEDLGNHTNIWRGFKTEGGRIEMPKSKTIHKKLCSPERDEEGHNLWSFSPIKFIRGFQCLTAWCTAIPPQLSILVHFPCLQSFGTCKMDAPPPMSSGIQSSRCLLERLDVYWQHWFLHEAQQAHWDKVLHLEGKQKCCFYLTT